MLDELQRHKDRMQMWGEAGTLEKEAQLIEFHWPIDWIPPTSGSWPSSHLLGVTLYDILHNNIIKHHLPSIKQILRYQL